MDSTANGLARLSLNQMTTERRSTRETLEACARHEIRWVSIWRHKLEELGLRDTARLVRDSGVRVSSLCRGGYFPASTQIERRRRIDDNLRALDEAAELGTDVLVLVCGPAADRDLDGARAMVEDAIGRLVPVAAGLGIKLGVEPLHPVFAADRSVVVTLRQAMRIVRLFPSDAVGVIVDAYHVWWDPDIYAEIAAAGSRIVGHHVSDWLVPAPDPLMGRGLMGDGVIEVRRLSAAVSAAGYRGPIEVEIFNDAVWNTPLDELLPEIKRRFLEHVT
jgi:sugar phosphate isomerase/epimerase